MNKLSHQKIWILLGIILVISTYIICLVPMEASGEGIPHLDKLVHFLIYFVLGFWFLLSLELKFSKIITISLVIMGISIELLQDLTPSRSFDYFDIVANCTGCFCGIIFGQKIMSGLFVKVENFFQKSFLN